MKEQINKGTKEHRNNRKKEQRRKGTKEQRNKETKVHPIGSGKTRSPGLVLSASVLTPAETKISVLLSAAVERFGVSRMRDFFIMH